MYMNATAQTNINSSSKDNGSTVATLRRDALAVSMVPLMMSVYLLFAVIAYEVQINHSRHKKQTGNSRKADGRIRQIIMCAAFTTLARQVLRTFELSEGFTNDSICSVVKQVIDALFVLIISLIYFALWMRQRVFYTSLLSSSSDSNFTKILGWCVIVLIVVGAVGGIVLYVGMITYKSSELGCIINETVVSADVPPAYYISTVILFQLILLFLFVHPLVKHNRYLKKTQLRSFPETTYKLLRRVAIVTAIDVLLDIAVISTIQLLRHSLTLAYLILFFDVTLTKSCVCVMCSFKDWKYRLFPFKCRTKTND